MVSKVKESMLLLSQAVVVLVGRRIESGSHSIARIGFVFARLPTLSSGRFEYMAQRHIVSSGLPAAVDTVIVSLLGPPRGSRAGNRCLLASG